MSQKRSLPAWLAFDRMKPALVTGLVLFVAGDALDLLLHWWGVPVSSTIFNNVAMGFLGALTLLVYLSASYEHHHFERAKERMELVSEVNRQVREALSAIAQSAMLEDRTERLRRLDEVTDQIDSMLTTLVPSSGSGRHARPSGKP
jgi:hypothetical protein